MEDLIGYQQNLLVHTQGNFFRYLHTEVPWDQRMIAIKGLRGAGKTTMILQHIKYFSEDGDKSLYVTADHPWFYTHTLLDLADQWYKSGGRILYIDEVHKYLNWSRELKNIYDGYPSMKVVFTASSALDIYRGESDLSRRVLTYELAGMSFREYLELRYNIKLPKLGLEDLFSGHMDQVAKTYGMLENPLALFKEYLISGYLPFTETSKETEYLTRLYHVIDSSISYDLAFIQNYSAAHAVKIKKLLGVIAESAPFEPNISGIAKKLNLGRDTVSNFLQHLQSARLLNLINRPTQGIAALQKPDKIYLENTNLSYALNGNPELGTIRETFLFSQLKNAGHRVELANKGDFLINGKHIVEVGGRDKSYKQIAGLENAYITADDIEVGFGNKIPLWLFGFLY
ncbi:ATP-binding protein [Pedobacter frigoris]|uniref:ATP-binding protein n=1 Tax=Pedobacter frigoris TaxID=2571272 RepID=A0A4U1CRN7_9SPHI|nr:AAA family ATPase [Pedobacter frigoris]TKC08539.1 ATP-binding protein [Pedobacter frigoris]